MKPSLWNVVAANMLLAGIAVTASCGCLCGRDKSPAVGSAARRSPGQDPSGKGEAWRFVASGDSRNCGDVVMPAIADGAKKDGAQFYWHLGDLRAIYDFDDDMLQEAKMAGNHLNIITYEKQAWDDFYKNQVAPFENMPFYLGIGNHETIPPKSRCEFVKRFSNLLDRPELQGGKKAPATPPGTKPPASKPANIDCAADPTALPCCQQRCAECDALRSRTYYRWIKSGVDFVYLDNASDEQFDADQLKWFDWVMQDDTASKDIQTVVVGMHKSLPWSVSCDHSMNETPAGTTSGVHVYQALVDLQKKGKKVYILSSHSHYYMADIYNTPHWIKNNAVLPGWIVGTAGAQRYQLPKGADLAKARANVYGYLLGRVYSDGHIDFEFTELTPGDVPETVRNRYSARFVSEACFVANRRSDPPEEKPYCKETP